MVSFSANTNTPNTAVFNTITAATANTSSTKKRLSSSVANTTQQSFNHLFKASVKNNGVTKPTTGSNKTNKPQNTTGTNNVAQKPDASLQPPTTPEEVASPASTEPLATTADDTTTATPETTATTKPALLSNDKKTETTKDKTNATEVERFTPLSTALDFSTQAMSTSIANNTALPVTTDVAVTDLHAVAAQVGGKLESLVANNNLATGARQVSMVLQPEALGNVRIQLQQDTGTQAISGRIIVQTPEALTALTQQFDGLKAQLEGQGITLQKLDIVLAPSADTTVLESQQHQAMLEVSSGGDTFNSSSDTDTASNSSKEFNNTDQSDEEAFNNQATNNNGFSSDGTQQEASGFSQQARKEAYQTHLNELRGLRSYRAALQGNSLSARYNT